MFKPISDLIKSIVNDPERLIANRYKLEKLLGKGSMGEVYCALDQNLGGINVAIKFLGQTLLEEKMRNRFENEAKISALLGEQSMHIVKVKDYGLNDNKVPFYVMELLIGNSLDKILKKKTLSLAKFLSLTRQICLGLECAHNGIFVNGELCPIIHRDIKPNNIFIVKDSNIEDLVKILDFGIAQVINSEQLETRSFMGTYEYCSPEQMAEKELDARSDLYSLGVLMYEMLTKEMPIKTENHNFKGWYDAHHNFIPKPLPRYLDLPSDLEEMIMACLAKSPDNRPQNIEEILKIIYPLEREINNKNASFESPKINFPKNNLSLEDLYIQSSWPVDKPQQKIVFPKVTESQEGTFASVWTMLETEEINKFNPNVTFCYNHFLFQSSPHPMLLWISLLYTRNRELKWLPCYLDLKTELGNQIIISLIKYKIYHILLFALNKSQKYQQILTIKISQDKIKQLETYLQKSNSWQGEKQPELSKKALKQQFEHMKVSILQAINKVKSN